MPRTQSHKTHEHHETPAGSKPASLPENYVRDEAEALKAALAGIKLDAATRRMILSEAARLVERVRRNSRNGPLIDALLLEYGLFNEEGIALMRLAEALIRTPDRATAALLVRDKIGPADWAAHGGRSQSPWVNAATHGLRLSAAWISASGGPQAERLYARLGDAVMVRAVGRAVAMLGDHFVLAQNIKAATRRAKSEHGKGHLYSYDMLGEAALTEADAAAYFDAYLTAMEHLAARAPKPSEKPSDGCPDVSGSDGLSIKLSALHPRFEYAQRDRCVPQLAARAAALAKIAKDANLGLTIDAEEADRLEVTLMVFEHLLQDPALEGWSGLGLAVQAYQRRALALIEAVARMTHTANRKICIRLVKGAYWDMEIKRAQELGLESYPVFTRKENTDANYLACARALLARPTHVFPQFATHNAHSAVAVIKMAAQHAPHGGGFELQRLHGMGAELHACLAQEYGVKTRIYAPVGAHRDLLAYLVRRLLENGANNSFVSQLTDRNIAVSELVRDPLDLCHANETAAHPEIGLPTACVEAGRLQAGGCDVTQSDQAAFFERAAQRAAAIADMNVGGDKGGSSTPVFSPQMRSHLVGHAPHQPVGAVLGAVDRLAADHGWSATSPARRAAMLDKAADLLAGDVPDLTALLVHEAGKTIADAITEIREAIDFCRYYASQVRLSAHLRRAPLGLVAAISPWNFPLAIFLGQITAALGAGNRVIAKPAEQTPLIAMRAVATLYRAGVPKTALELVTGDGGQLGGALTRHPSIGGILFTGSTATAKKIARGLGATGRGDIPLIAETGGVNAMIVDSTALPEQAVRDVTASAFQSAGQRCSACRLVCVQEDVYDAFVDMLSGAMDQITIGHPGFLKTDVGPLIDAAAHEKVEAYKRRAAQKHKVLKACALPEDLPEGFFSAPLLVELANVNGLAEEVFGPVLHIVKFDGAGFEPLLDDINAMGYGLTMGLHTRLDSRVNVVSQKARVGNLYVNRNQIGAVVGVHPFGGEGLSGTGPKAGGPHYLAALTRAPQKSRVAPARGGPSVNAGGGGERTRLAALCAEAASAARDWRQNSDAAARAADVRAGLAATASPHEMQALAGDLSYAATMRLPGPTGEENALHLRPRGVFVCFGSADARLARRQLGKILTAGSAALVAAPADAAVSKMISELTDTAHLPGGLVRPVSHEDALDLLDMPIDAIVADGASRPAAAARAAERSGPIIPLLSADDPIERYCHERCVSINATAAGGNFSLLTLNRPVPA